jgi:hypothetical protein
MAWKLGSSAANAHTVATVAHRLRDFPRCAAGLAEGRLSLDQLGAIAARAGEGSDEHYARLARVARVGQLCTAVKCEPRPEPDPRPQRSITTIPGEQSCCWQITLPHEEAAMFDAALASHREALISEWKHDRGADGAASAVAPPMPGTLEAFCGWCRPAGTPRRLGAHTVCTPRWWWCTSMPASAPRRCIGVQHSATPNAAT